MLPYDGLEVDVLSLGDADCLFITRWLRSVPFRILIDGGCAKDAPTVVDFLRQRGYTTFLAAICTHLHNDHASGLTKILKDNSIAFIGGWMHDITKHVSAETLRRSSAAIDGVKEVVENTRQLAAAFAARGITPKEPFAGMTVFNMAVLGPSLSYYTQVMMEFTKVEIPLAPMPIPYLAAQSMLGKGAPLAAGLANIARASRPIMPIPAQWSPFAPAVPLRGLLENSSVQRNPRTQPFNNTSVILGVNFNESRLLFTGDAGSDALTHVGPEWHHLWWLGVPHHASDGNLSQRDIERFCPRYAVISAKGDSNHPSRAIVSGLVKAGAKVASTHKHGNLWFSLGKVPPRSDYSPIADFLEGTGSPMPYIPRWRSPK